MRTLVLFGLVFSSAATGAVIEFGAYDFQHCQRWYISAGGGDGSQAYQEAVRLEKAQPNASSAAFSSRRSHEFTTAELEELAIVFSASTFKDRSQTISIQKFGVCTYKSYQNPAEFSCLPSQDFPFSGATYRGVKKKSDLLWMKCSSGCDRAKPSVIVVTLNINEEGADETKEHRALRSDFQRRCKKDH